MRKATTHYPAPDASLISGRLVKMKGFKLEGRAILHCFDNGFRLEIVPEYVPDMLFQFNKKTFKFKDAKFRIESKGPSLVFVDIEAPSII